MKIKLGITKQKKGLYMPYFWIGNQGFNMEVTNKETAQFMIKMVEGAFKRLNNQVEIERIKGLKYFYGISHGQKK